VRKTLEWVAARLHNLEPDELEQLEAAIPLLAQLLEAPE
jgi:hypothetical protein